MKLVLISTLVILGLASRAFGDSGFSNQYLTALLEAAADEAQSKQTPTKSNIRLSLNCPFIPGGGTPTSVHQLKPSDIDYIGAIGDSLTAANGAKANYMPALIYEYRGVSWSIGCEASLDKVITFATILKTFNKNLWGCSTDTSKQNATPAYLNLAHPGHTSYEMLGQAQLLVSRLKANVLYPENHWKIINFFIGGNDLCEFCETSRQTVDNFVKNIRETLDYFKFNLPRTLINLVLTLDVSGIEELFGLKCRGMQTAFCKCGLDNSTEVRTKLLALTNAYQVEIKKLIDSGRYDTDNLFTVNVHMFMTKMKPPRKPNGEPDDSLFAPDCFHFSQKGHEYSAKELWNSMLTPYHLRRDTWNLDEPVKCPTIATPYIYTSQNSKSLKTLLRQN